MNENEILDDSLLENIEGLLFSEEYADSDDNSSLISEIAGADIPAEEGTSDGDGEDAAAKDSDKNDSQKANVKENVLNIDFSEDPFEKGFGSLAIEKIRDSIRAYKGPKRFFIENHSIKEGLIENFPVWTYDDSERSSFDSCMRAGLGVESLRESVDDLKNTNAPVDYSVGTSKEVASSSVRAEKSKVPVEKNRSMIAAPIMVPDVSKKTKPYANSEKTKLSAREVFGVEKPNKAEISKDTKFSAINTEPPKTSWDSEKTSAMWTFEKPKSVAREVFGVEKPNKAESNKDSKFSAINTEPTKTSWGSEKTSAMSDFDKPKSVAREVLDVEKLSKTETSKETKFSAINPEPSKVSRDSEKTNAMPDFDKPKSVAREVLGVEKPSRAETNKDAKFSAISTESSKVSRNSEKTNAMPDFDKPKTVAREVLGVEKPSKAETNKDTKFSAINAESSKVSRDSEKTSAMSDFDKPKSIAREVLGVEKSSRAETNKDAKFSAINAESSKVSRDSEKTSTMSDFDKPKTVAREVLGVEKPNKAETDKDTKFSAINPEPSKASSINPEKSRDSVNSEKVKPAPKKDFAEKKSDYKNIASNSAISITGDRSLNMTSSCSQKQDDMSFDTENNGKRNTFEKRSFNVFGKDYPKYTIQKRTSFFSMTERSSTKKNIDSAFEKKSRMSMFNEKRISAYDCMKNEFKRKKELF